MRSHRVEPTPSHGIRQVVLLLVLLLVAACSNAPEYDLVAVDESAAPLLNEEGGQEVE
jgi:hypothetical protein